MITEGPLAWSSLLRFDRLHGKVVVRSTGHSVAHVLTQFAGGADTWNRYRGTNPRITVDDLDACQRFVRVEIENPGKCLFSFLQLDDTVAAGNPIHPFLKRVAEEVPLTYGPRPKAVSVQDALLRILHTASDLFGASTKPLPVVNREPVLETLARIAAECLRSAEDLGLIEGEIIDPDLIDVEF